MGLLSNLSSFRIRTRITILAAVSMLGIAALGGAYIYGDTAMQHAGETQAAYEQLMVQVSEIEIGALQMRRREKDFLLRKDLQYRDKYDVAASGVLEHLEAAAGLEGAAPLSAEIARLREGVPAHQAQFRTVVQDYEALGLDEKQGLQGDLRKAVHEIEAKLEEASLDDLTIKMLMMRRHEKDFMLRGAEKYIDRIDKRRQEFDLLLNEAPLAAGAKQEISRLMDAYQKNFHAWAERYLVVQKDTRKLSEIFAAMAPDLETILQAAEHGSLEAGATAAKVRGLTHTIMLVAAVAVFVLATMISFLIGRSIIRPMAMMTEAMTALAGGDTRVAIPATEARDEIGEMARAAEVFKQNAIERERLAAESTDSERRAAAERERAAQDKADAERRAGQDKAEAEARQAEDLRQQQESAERRAEQLMALTATFDTKVSTVLNSVTTAANDLRQTSFSMTDTAKQTSQRSTAMATAVEQAISSVQTVATASEELSSSISEISRQVSNSTDIAGKAVAETQRTTETMRGLADAADSIGAVVNLIQDIAEQTNLLALNATIEAARAGDAGKGFAVVASEVKSLANQTAKATEDIADKIGSIQNSAGDAVSAIDKVSGIIGQISDIAETIANSVQQQGTATQEIAQSAQQAAAGTSEVTENIAQVSASASEADRTAALVGQMADGLSRQAAEIKSEVEQFIAKVQAA